MATKIKDLSELLPAEFPEDPEDGDSEDELTDAEALTTVYTPNIENLPQGTEELPQDELLAQAMELLAMARANPKLQERLTAFRAQAQKQTAAERAQAEADALATQTAALMDVVREAVYNALTGVTLPDAAGGVVIWVKRSADGEVHMMDIQGAVLQTTKYDKAASAYQSAIADKKRTSAGAPTERNRTIKVIVAANSGTLSPLAPAGALSIDVYDGRGPVAKCLDAYGATNYYSRSHPSGPSVTAALAALAVELGKYDTTVQIHKADGTIEFLPTA